MKNIVMIIAVVLLLTLGVCLAVYMAGRDERLHTAVISLDGEVIRTIDLDTATDETFTVESDHGYNIICVLDGEIFIKEASCPDKICVDHGILKSEYLPIICLPNRLIIELM